jgi:superfamily II DNA or RNA helicase
MDYNELYEKYQKLLAENQKIKAVNEEYRRRFESKMPVSLFVCDNETVTDNQLSKPEFNNSSPPEDKIKLFMSLFRGRDDVYAERWVDKKGSPGYSFVCLNKFVRGICKKPKTKIKCSECPNKEYVPLRPEVIDRHLRGKDVHGVYPMLEDETCYFLAIDFDGDSWKKDISVIREICAEKKIPCAVERSRSGNGAHLWFFFEDRVSAVLARKFGSALLTQAMGRRHEIKFTSYDRLFPSQDTLPKERLGNLIALPLQMEARKNDNSVFIDENFQPYPDQWSFLSNVGKLTEREIDLYFAELCAGSELGDLRQSEDEEDKPWERSRVGHRLDRSDFPGSVQITKANMLYIRKDGFSHKALNAVKRLAAFKNPDFYKAQAMRLPTGKKPRVISLSDETAVYLGLPRGCEIELVDFFNDHKVKYELADETYGGRRIDVEFHGELLGEQAESADALLNFDNGVLHAATAFGKTVIAAHLISTRKVNTLVLVHTRQLFEQWKKRMHEFLVINEVLPVEAGGKGRKKKRSVIGQIGAGKNNLSGIVDIAVMHSLVKGDEVRELVRGYGMVIVDECHHVPAVSFEKIIKHATAKYVYGLTATPVRRDGHHPIVFMHCGPVRYKVDAYKQAEKRPFDHFVIPRFTPFRKPVSQDEKEWHITEIYTEISTSEIRNRLIIDDVVKSVNDGRNPLILTERTAHVELLVKALQETLPNVITLTGSMPAKERKAAMEALAATPKDQSVVLVATGRFVGEGFDEPRLDTLFLAMPVAWKGTVQQYAGRLHRLYETKSNVQIYDYVDVHVGVLERMYQKRLKVYASIGYTAKSDSKPFESVNVIFNNNDFLPVFSNDISAARNEVIIVSPYIRKRRLDQMLSILVAAIDNGAKLTVVTRPETDYKEKDRLFVREAAGLIENAGINLIYKSNIHQKFAIVDQRIVWYGSVNLLSFGSSEESIMRLDSVNIANELTGTIEV